MLLNPPKYLANYSARLFILSV